MTKTKCNLSSVEKVSVRLSSVDISAIWVRCVCATACPNVGVIRGHRVKVSVRRWWMLMSSEIAWPNEYQHQICALYSLTIHVDESRQTGLICGQTYRKTNTKYTVRSKIIYPRSLDLKALKRTAFSMAFCRAAVVYTTLLCPQTQCIYCWTSVTWWSNRLTLGVSVRNFRSEKRKI